MHSPKICQHEIALTGSTCEILPQLPNRHQPFPTQRGVASLAGRTGKKSRSQSPPSPNSILPHKNSINPLNPLGTVGDNLCYCWHRIFTNRHRKGLLRSKNMYTFFAASFSTAGSATWIIRVHSSQFLAFIFFFFIKSSTSISSGELSRFAPMLCRMLRGSNIESPRIISMFSVNDRQYAMLLVVVGLYTSTRAIHSKTPGSTWPGKGSIIEVKLHPGSKMTQKSVSFLQIWQIMRSDWSSSVWGHIPRQADTFSGHRWPGMELDPNGPFPDQVWTPCFWNLECIHVHAVQIMHMSCSVYGRGAVMARWTGLWILILEVTGSKPFAAILFNWVDKPMDSMNEVPDSNPNGGSFWSLASYLILIAQSLGWNLKPTRTVTLITVSQGACFRSQMPWCRVFVN